MTRAFKFWIFSIKDNDELVGRLVVIVFLRCKYFSHKFLSLLARQWNLIKEKKKTVNIFINLFKQPFILVLLVLINFLVTSFVEMKIVRFFSSIGGIRSVFLFTFSISFIADNSNIFFIILLIISINSSAEIRHTYQSEAYFTINWKI